MSNSQSSATLIGITGATGAIGSRVAQRLVQRNVKQRLLVRDLNRAPNISGAEVVQFSGYRDKASMTAALQGVDTLFLVSGHLSDDRVKDHTTAVDAALESNVKHIVYLSFLNAAPDATFLAARDHFRTEDYIRACGVPFTFLRASLYADLAPRYFGKDAVIRGPAGDGRVSYVTRDDIADVAAIVLTGEGHDSKTYNMTGPEALTLTEVAALLSEISGQHCTYYNETMDEAKKSRAVYNASDEMVAIWISTYVAIAKGELSLVSGDIERLIGHPARTLRDFLLQYPESYQHLASEDETK